MMDEIEFGADKITVRGPKIDGSYVITFETGEYEKDKVAQMIKMEVPVKVVVRKWE